MRVKKESFRITSLFLFAMMTAAMPGQGAMAQPTGDTRTMGADTARSLALQALQQGNLKLAAAVSSALLAKDPNDAEALIVRAQLLRATGQLDAARATAAAAYRNSENPSLRFDAAMLAAGVTSKAGWRATAPCGATCSPRNDVTSAGSRSSIGMASPFSMVRSTVESGAAT